ncbi:hypothetical protein BMS_2237 [Halobacteriovorax marinus SJ]|uniref:Uncharacterized protein n=1 Tax=Halobacteriovorax marinus (strain ATCC BAA-682 / DSM 15412 / SJ) TaxID=862908 RepID=E1X467_HALMS|nr:hypothetical protein BMS_2237 [Halobacteriovorax marinus SJ]
MAKRNYVYFGLILQWGEESGVQLTVVFFTILRLDLEFRAKPLFALRSNPRINRIFI